MAVVMGVDSSTQSTKVVLHDADNGARVAEGHAPHPPTSPPVSEQDPHAWWDALVAARGAAGSTAERPAAVAVAAQQHGCVVLGADDRVLRPAKLWNDTTSAPDAAWLVDQLAGGAAAWAEACGSVPVAALTITKLSWLHRTEPERFARVARVLLPHDWLTWRLTGRFTTDRGDASGTGYWSPTLGTWRTDLLAIVDDTKDWGTCLPEVLGPGERAGEHDGAIVAPGTGDNMAAALGLGLEPGDVSISLGTSGVVATVCMHATADPTGAVDGFADATGRYLPLVCTLNATKVTDAVGGWLGADHDRLTALALAAPPGGDGVVLVPYLDGERTPDRPDATGTLTGLRSDTTAEQIARAAFEGVVCGLLDGLDALGAAGVPTDGRLLLVGGGARSVAYQRVLADVAQRAVTVPDDDQLVATGAAVQAAAVLHGTAPDDIARAWGAGAGCLVAPDPSVDAVAVRAAYAEARG